jgi:argininosuccinate lyase
MQALPFSAAQPISFAQHLMAYACMLSRDVTGWRLRKRMNECPWAQRLAGTTYPIDRWATAKAMGFSGP